MNPLLITKNSFQVMVEVSNTITEIASFVRDFNESAREMSALSGELCSLKISLVALAQDAEQNADVIPDDLASNTLEIISQCKEIVDSIQTLLKKFPAGSFKQKLDWAKSGKAEAMRLKTTLEMHKSSLLVAIESTTL